MNRLSARNSPFATLVLAAALAGCGAASAERIVVATEESSATGIQVTGSGEVSTRPDTGHLHLGVESRAATAEQATAATRSRMKAVLEALEGAGIAEKDVRTRQLSIFRDFEPQPPPVVAPASAPAGPPTKGMKPSPVTVPPPPSPSSPSPDAPRTYEVFRASNEVDVTLRDLDHAGQALTAATLAGANEMNGLDLTLDDPKPFEQKARDKAMADARARAEQLAALAGVRLGPVLAIQESSGGATYPHPMAMMKSATAEAMPVERGEIKITREVQVRYAIAK
jgi:uncharacterized protein YggE